MSLLGTQNPEQRQTKQQPQTKKQSQKGQRQTEQRPKGQPQGIAPTVGDVVGALKSLFTNDYIRNVKQNNWQPFNKKIWQRDYYEHIIRNKKSYDEISKYIQTNPLKWQGGKYYK